MLFSFNNLSFAQSQEKNDVSMFPKPKADEQQIIIQLPELANEEDYKIEIYAGKMHEKDCNSIKLSGQIDENNLDGWGYTYYRLTTNGNVASTLMGCMDQKKTQAFVSVQSNLLRYNSKLPYVIYVPKNYQVKYKIWKGSELKTAQ